MTRHNYDRFVYNRYHLDYEGDELCCEYSLVDSSGQLEDVVFSERYLFPAGTLSPGPAVEWAARLVFLLAAVSYYKAAAPRTIDLNGHDLTVTETSFLHRYYRYGLGEFAVVNERALVDVEFVGAMTDAAVSGLDYVGDRQRLLIPFGGGLDSIVSLERVRGLADSLSLFVVSHPGDMFEAIALAAGVAETPVLSVARVLDPKILESKSRGYLNGHVPVTGIISALAVLAAVATGHGAVVMSNEWSASFGNTEVDGESVNHQWSKSADFENMFSELLSQALDGFEYFSMLRSDSELQVAKEFQQLDRYHLVFRSCNRAFHVDPAARLDHWCGRCDKCAFIDLILSPFLTADRLGQIFSESGEPLRNPAMVPVFESLISAVGASHKPFECVGEINECRAAVRLAVERQDRCDPVKDPVLHHLLKVLPNDPSDLSAQDLLQPLGEDNVPTRFRAVRLS